jgi:hypothetical protein
MGCHCKNCGEQYPNYKEEGQRIKDEASKKLNTAVAITMGEFLQGLSAAAYSDYVKVIGHVGNAGMIWLSVEDLETLAMGSRCGAIDKTQKPCPNPKCQGRYWGWEKGRLKLARNNLKALPER